MPSMTGLLMHINVTARMDLAQLGPKCDVPIEEGYRLDCLY